MTVVSRFRTGQRLADLRGPLNRLVDAVNQPRREVPLPPSVRGIQVLELEIKAFATNATDGSNELTCVDVGMAADPAAFEYTVRLPQTFIETTRGAIAYVYTDINNRTADASENQEMTPNYIVGDRILATRILDDDGALRDLNVDGRQWAKV